jgi:hypothetical protein
MPRDPFTGERIAGKLAPTEYRGRSAGYSERDPGRDAITAPSVRACTAAAAVAAQPGPELLQAKSLRFSNGVAIHLGRSPPAHAGSTNRNAHASKSQF